VVYAGSGDSWLLMQFQPMATIPAKETASAWDVLTCRPAAVQCIATARVTIHQVSGAIQMRSRYRDCYTENHHWREEIEGKEIIAIPVKTQEQITEGCLRTSGMQRWSTQVWYDRLVFPPEKT
jgi:hypothetical protein